MLFTQLEFVFFFCGILAFILLVKNFRAQKLFLLAASYYFYGYWNYTFLLLIFVCTIINYYAGITIEATEVPWKRKSVLIFSLVFSLGILGYYKYCNFFITTFHPMLAKLSWNLSTLNIILPAGISFFTFQSMSYTIDIYRRKIKLCPDFFDFSLFIAFFPQLVAGPIVRASEFLPQLESPRQLNGARTYAGIRQFMIGLLKKVLIADSLSLFVDPCFAAHTVFSGPTIFLAILGYTLQIYCDFSGYSDMAIGIARVLGYDFNVNFDIPYISKNITEFWRRWHISLSSWLRDYLYIPLGGNRKGRSRTYINLMITMLLGGLWHGAAWNFVFWGAWHGGALAVDKYVAERFSLKIPTCVSWIITFLIVIVGWVFFRARSFTQAFAILQKIACWENGVNWFDPLTVLILILATFAHLLHVFPNNMINRLAKNSWCSTTAFFLILYLVIIFRPEGFQPFIYFQF